MAKEARFKTADNRWGKGKVHRYIYSRENKMWYVSCRSPGNDPFGTIINTEPLPEITCKRCL